VCHRGGTSSSHAGGSSSDSETASAAAAAVTDILSHKSGSSRFTDRDSPFCTPSMIGGNTFIRPAQAGFASRCAAAVAASSLVDGVLPVRASLLVVHNVVKVISKK
jgi:hypothetical protein